MLDDLVSTVSRTTSSDYKKEIPIAQFSRIDEFFADKKLVLSDERQ